MLLYVVLKNEMLKSNVFTLFVIKDNQDCLELLIAEGADPTHKDNEGLSGKVISLWSLACSKINFHHINLFGLQDYILLQSMGQLTTVNI